MLIVLPCDLMSALYACAARQNCGHGIPQVVLAAGTNSAAPGGVVSTLPDFCPIRGRGWAVRRDKHPDGSATTRASRVSVRVQLCCRRVCGLCRGGSHRIPPRAVGPNAAPLSAGSSGFCMSVHMCSSRGHSFFVFLTPEQQDPKSESGTCLPPPPARDPQPAKQLAHHWW